MENSRRNFIKKTAMAGVGISVLPSLMANQIISSPNQILRGASFTLPELPYAFNALEPYIDEQTMKIHHGKHHAAYVNNLNKAAESIADFPENLETVFANMEKYPAAVRNNGGGHWNHTFFWKCMQPGKENNLPQGKIAEAINRDFGSFEEFKKKFKETALGQFGSGWAWLIKEPDGKLIISGTPNQDNPLMSLSAKKGIPVLGLDVWEHAYYLKYQNKRGDYIDNFWYVVNWNQVAENFK